jgi:hypothetical protein
MAKERPARVVPENRELEIFYLSDRPHQATANYELSPGRITMDTSAYNEDDYTEAFVEAFMNIRHALALAGIVGRMRFYPSPLVVVDEEVETVARRAIALFTKAELLTITQDDLKRAPIEEAEYLRWQEERIRYVEEFVDAQRREEGERISINEAWRRREEGTAKLRRIVDPDDSERDAADGA